jgi:hypothetical protein
MKIELKEITIREIVEGYYNHKEEGIVGYGGRLNIRPAYQREFIYKSKQQEAVIDSIKSNFPLGVMYWIKTDDGYELLDGQQRTVSICNYVDDTFSINFKYFHNLTDEEKEQILNYTLMVYICEGKTKERLDWFKIINIAGEKLTSQELRNAVYTGPWLLDAKKHFSKTGCPAYDIAKKYLKGTPIRQNYLETAIKWISNNHIEDYMAVNQHVANANELWLYFNRVINWTKTVFINYRREMKGIDFGFLYNEFKDSFFDSAAIENEIIALMVDDDVTKKSGIYYYVLTRDKKFLNIRSFSTGQSRIAYENQGGICPVCKKDFDIDEMEADHITPWVEGGKTSLNNLQMLCKHCNRLKSNK